MIIERDPGVVPVGDFDPGGLVLESLSEQLTWKKLQIQVSRFSYLSYLTCYGVVAADNAPGFKDALLGLLPEHPLVLPLLLQLHLDDRLLVSPVRTGSSRCPDAK